MIKIVGLFPLDGNGGIASWTKTFLREFPDNEYFVKGINTRMPLNSKAQPKWKHVLYGLFTALRVRKELRKEISESHYDIMHTTTSGGLGSFRDLLAAKVCRKHGIKTILHCRYGCIPEDYTNKGLVGRLLNVSFSLYDQIWVLDNRTYNFLQKQPSLAQKIRLTPNPIEVKDSVDLKPKSYKRVGFVGNVLETKGIKELTKAVCQLSNTRLDIIGPANEKMLETLKEISGNKWGKEICYHGRVPNEQAVAKIKDMDIIVLPTYYRQEAFPMSIIESMSLSKLVISTRRAAIPDMLTDLDGGKCGILVEERNSEAIAEAIRWCQDNSLSADKMCRKAYEKVYNAYRREIVYDMYRTNYQQLMKK